MAAFIAFTTVFAFDTGTFFVRTASALTAFITLIADGTLDAVALWSCGVVRVDRLITASALTAFFTLVTAKAFCAVTFDPALTVFTARVRTVTFARVSSVTIVARAYQFAAVTAYTAGFTAEITLTASRTFYTGATARAVLAARVWTDTFAWVVSVTFAAWTLITAIASGL